MPPKPLPQLPKARPRASKPPIRATRSPGSPGSSPASADGTATTSRPDRKPHAPDGHSSPPSPRVSLSQSHRQSCESRSAQAEVRATSKWRRGPGFPLARECRRRMAILRSQS
jgi:hypothetical protein